MNNFQIAPALIAMLLIIGIFALGCNPEQVTERRVARAAEEMEGVWQIGSISYVKGQQAIQAPADSLGSLTISPFVEGTTTCPAIRQFPDGNLLEFSFLVHDSHSDLDDSNLDLSMYGGNPEGTAEGELIAWRGTFEIAKLDEDSLVWYTEGFSASLRNVDHMWIRMVRAQ